MRESRDCSKIGSLSLALWMTTVLSLAWRSTVNFAPQKSTTCFDRTTSLQPSVSSKYSTTIEIKESVPYIAWLMSFPNSGTSYTLRTVRHVSNMTTATNYGDEYMDETTNSSFMWDNMTNGPFRAYPNLPLPAEFILTKTHCASRCVHCGPDGYLETPLSFQRGCLRSNRMLNNTETELFYSRSHVRRAVHLMRHPLDNVVARFHLSRRRGRSSHLPNNETGFQEWCRNLDTSYTWMEQHTRWIDPNLRHMWREIPCHAEFFRWVQWHNLAHITGIEMGFEMMILKYEDYHHDWEGTVQELCMFLRLPVLNPLGAWQQEIPFLMRSYHSYFTRKQKHQIRKMMLQFASVPVWKLIQRYFGGEERISNVTKKGTALRK